jgi:hypothetical protein
MAERGRRGAPESDLVKRGRADGARAAQAGEYDEWSFEQEQGIAYAQQLEKQEEVELADEVIEYGKQRSALSADKEAAARNRQIGRRVAVVELDRARAAVERNREHREVSRAQLDLLTGVHEPRPEDGADPGPGVPGQWAGPASGVLSPPVPRRLKLLLVVLLATVEIPIYFSTFRMFDPRDMLLVWCFTVPVALLMVVAPHIAGVWLRKRLATPSLGPLPTIGAAALMVVWAGAAVVLAKLRVTSLVHPVQLYGIDVPSPVTTLGPATLLAAFGLVIALSGLISFLLGMADDHPAVSAFAAADRALRQAEETHVRATSTHASGLIEDAEEPDVSPEEALEEEHRKRLEAITADYAASWAAYRDAWSLAAGNPAKTQAAGVAAPHTRATA